jgi:flagellar protein FlaG
VLLTIAAVVAVVATINAIMPAVSRAGNALVTSADVADDRLSSRIEIIHATGQDGAVVAQAWVKNTGSARIIALEHVDVFFGPQSNFQRIPYGGPGCTAPCWDFELENDTEWNPTATIHITIALQVADTLTAGNTYFIKIVAPNGVEDSKFFTL